MTQLRELWIGLLDFEADAGTQPITLGEHKVTAHRVARRDGVAVLALQASKTGHVRSLDIREAARRLRTSFGDWILLCVSNLDGSEWEFVWPSFKEGRDVLRRMGAQRGHPARTLWQQLAGIDRVSRAKGVTAALDAAFDVEPVTKAFFKQYREVFGRVENLIEGPFEGSGKRLFCQTLFNRLMFLYFLQRKGCLKFDGDANYLHALWKSHRAARRPESTALDADAAGGAFYATRLRLLFFTALANARSAGFDRARSSWAPLVGEVPFLNGGLFSEEPLDKLKGVVVPDEAIRLIVEDLFERFNFTITESTPTDIQVAVDPEMLGKVFEELVTGRHEHGSYYTPRPIVHFMCQEAVKGFLYSRQPDVPHGAIDRYVEDHDVSALTDDQALRIVEALREIRVVDPACGSGAYLLGMLQELLELRRLIWNEKLLRDPQREYDLKLHIIEKNVYGVDIDRFAVNIAMLRLWLSLTIEYEGDTPPPLPNLDYKIVRGDSLTGPAPVQVGGQHDIFQQEAARRVRRISELKAEYMTKTGEEKSDLDRAIGEEMSELGKTLELTAAGNAVQWSVVFAEVFEGRPSEWAGDSAGGFDAVLANPPYVRQELIRDQKPALKRVYGDLFSGAADLYVYFYYRAIQLLRPGGMLVFISSNKWMRSAYATNLRRQLGERTAVWSILNFGDLPVFQDTIAYPLVLVAQAGAPATSLRYADVPSLGAPYPDVRGVALRYGTERAVEAGRAADSWPPPDKQTARFICQMEEAGTPLGEYVNGQIYYGIKTGLNEAFVIDGTTRERLVREDPNSEEIIKPFATGRAVKRWYVQETGTWIILTRVGVDIERYPAILRHLSQWEGGLRVRQDQGNHWWELRPCDYYAAFDSPKIVYPVITDRLRFAFGPPGLHSNDKTFVIPVDDFFLLGVLNSAAAWHWLSAKCSPLQNGFLEQRRIYLEHFPVPSASGSARRAIAGLVEDCAAAAARGSDLQTVESELNAAVAAAYGLGPAVLASAGRPPGGPP